LQRSLGFSQLSAFPGNRFKVVADLLTVSKDFFFAGAAADVTPELRPILSQFLMGTTKVLAVLSHAVASGSDIFEVLPNLRFVMMAAVVMSNITPVAMPVIASVLIPTSSMIAVSPSVIALPIRVLVSPEVRVLFPVFAVGIHGNRRDNQSPSNHCA
jgi:hypothetical protein